MNADFLTSTSGNFFFQLSCWVVNLVPEKWRDLERIDLLRAAMVVGAAERNVKWGQVEVQSPWRSFHIKLSPRERLLMHEFGRYMCMSNTNGIIRTAVMVGLDLTGARDGQYTQPPLPTSHRIANLDWKDLIRRAASVLNATPVEVTYAGFGQETSYTST